jgi:hypothetical protein
LPSILFVLQIAGLKSVKAYFPTGEQATVNGKFKREQFKKVILNQTNLEKRMPRIVHEKQTLTTTLKNLKLAIRMLI